MELDFRAFVIKIDLNFNSQGTKNVELFSQGTYSSQYLTYVTLFIAITKQSYGLKRVMIYRQISSDVHSNAFI